jgi:hypothetical protein
MLLQLSPYDTAGDFEFPGGSLENEMINPLAQMLIPTMILILNN